MSHYLDTSVVVAMLLRDAHTPKATSWFERHRPTTLVSTLVKAEFSAAVSRQVRMRQQSVTEAKSAFSNLDRWLGSDAELVACSNHDILAADLLVRDLASKLSAPDAIHLAVARRIGAVLVTFDGRLAEAARRHAMPVEVP